MSDRPFPLLDRPTLIDWEQGNGRYFYRGASLSSINNDEFRDNNINGIPVNVYDISGFEIMYNKHDHVSPTTTEIMSDILADPGNPPFDRFTVNSVEERWVTGGLTENIGTALHFGTPAYEHGLVLIMDRDRITKDLVDIEYNMSFFNKYPEIGAYIHQMANTAVMQDGELLALAKVEPYEHEHLARWAKHVEDVRAKHVYGVEIGYQVEDSLLGSNIYSSENETVALAKNIDLDHAIVGIGAYYGQSTTPHNLEPIRDKELSWDEKQKFDYSSLEEKTKIVYEDVKSKMALRGRHEEKFSVVILKDLHRNLKEDTRVAEDNFELLYNGQEFIEEYDNAHPYV